MDDEYGSDFITISDEDGNEFELEVLDSLERNGVTYMALINTAAEDSDSEDDGLIILKIVEENGEEFFMTPDSDEELNEIYALFMERLFEEEPSED